MADGRGIAFFDAHCHLQSDRLTPFLDEILQKADNAGVSGMACCGTREEDWEAVAGLSAAYKRIFPFFGIHPWYVDALSDGWRDALEGLLVKTGAGVGETGLDHVGPRRNDDTQEAVFEEHLKLAVRLKRPVAVHCRKAWGALTRILEKSGGLSCPGVMHSYSGPAELVPELEGAGFYISFSGSITRKENKKGRAALQAVSPDRLLLETDSPDLMPQGASGGFNEPANIRYIAAAVAEILNISLEQLAEKTYHNACKCLQINPYKS